MLLAVCAILTCLRYREDLGDFTTLSTTFTVNLASGTQVVLSLEDASGDEAWSGIVGLHRHQLLHAISK